jgi:hypothetical protein
MEIHPSLQTIDAEPALSRRKWEGIALGETASVMRAFSEIGG